MEKGEKNSFIIGWLIYFILSILIVYISSILQKSNILLVISSIFGVIYSLLIAKEKRIAFIFGIINVSTYGYLLFAQKLYGGLIYNILYSLPMLIWGYIKWKKVQNKENSGVKIISNKNRIVLTIVFTLLIMSYSLVLKSIGGYNYILDSITSVLGYLGIYLMSNKYIEQWIVWIICNLANTILWYMLSAGNTNNIPMLMMWIIYLINSIYGYITWRKKYNKRGKI